jgi:exopolysaccharide biosynthesis protein
VSRILRIWPVLLWALAAAAQDSSPRDAWRQKQVAPGVVWRYRHFQNLFGAKQSVSVLEANPDQKGVRLRFADAGGLKRTSQMAQAGNAVAAVNGGFYNGRGEAYALFKIDGRVLKAGDDRWPAFGVDSKERVQFHEKPPGNWESVSHALACGPTLVVKGKVRIGDMFGHSNDRHPRTAMGITRTRRVILVTVDGRTPSSAGMSFDELAKLMLDLGCESAINLDGGGSTTMWVKGEPEGGIVNHPCDNRKFDHAGERAVGNAVLILSDGR